MASCALLVKFAPPFMCVLYIDTASVNWTPSPANLPILPDFQRKFCEPYLRLRLCREFRPTPKTLATLRKIFGDGVNLSRQITPRVLTPNQAILPNFIGLKSTYRR